MKFPSVSVIIPTCNRPQMLKRALDSVVAQDYPNITEIIVTDDGSEDESEKLCLKYSSNDKRIIYSRNLKYPKGPTGNKQNAYELISGDFVAGVDDDDELLKDAVSSLMKVHLEKGYKAIFCNCVRSDNGKFTGKHYGRDEEVGYEDLLCARYDGEYFGINSRDIIKEARFIHELAGMEGIAWLTLYKNKKIRAYYLHRVGRIYNVHADQFSNTYENNAKRSYYAYHTLLNFFGNDLAALCPNRYAYLSQLAAYFAKVSSKNSEAIKHSIDAAKIKKFSFFSWCFLFLMMMPLPPKVVILMKKFFTGVKKL